MSRAAAIVAGLVTLCAVPAVATAEEGLFVARASYGASTVHPDMPHIGQMWSLSSDLTLTERTGLIGGAVLVLHDQARSLGLHLGIKTLLVERFWKRLYIHLSPELVRVWQHGKPPRWDAALRLGLGYEHLLMWGFGVVIELQANAPLGSGDAKRLTAAAAGATAGLFMEF